MRIGPKKAWFQSFQGDAPRALVSPWQFNPMRWLGELHLRLQFLGVREKEHSFPHLRYAVEDGVQKCVSSFIPEVIQGLAGSSAMLWPP